MKKFIAVLLVCQWGLSACGGGDSSAVSDSSADFRTTGPEYSRLRFKPADGVLDVPNDLLFSGTADGTLEPPDEVSARSSGVPDYSNPATALGALDGWSAQMPWVLHLDMAEGATLSAATVSAQVHLYQTIASQGAADTNPACSALPAGLPCLPVTELVQGVDYVVVPGADSITILPLRPLQAATTYLLALTRGIEDSRGLEVASSPTYELVTDDSVTIVNPTLAALAGAVAVYENVVAAASGGTMTPDDVIHSVAVTTSSIGVEFAAIKAVMAASIPAVTVNAAGVTAADLLGVPSGTALDLADVYTGSVQLPYYLSDDEPLDQPWRALCDSGVVLATSDLSAVTPGANDATCQLLGLRDFGLDSERHLTRYNPMPQARSLQTVEVLMTQPNAGAGCAAGPYPIVILQHGITLNKESMLTVTGALSAACLATIAIDHPLHGSRGFDLDGDLVDDVNASTGAVTDYINLANLLVARDNLRQSIADMLGLRLGLNQLSVDAAAYAPPAVYVAGLSLGAIASASFAAIANTPAGAFDPLYQVSAVTLTAPGGGIAPLLMDSPSFGNLIKGSVLAAAGTELSQQFVADLATPDSSCTAYSPASSDYLGCQYQAFVAELAAQGDTESLGQLSDLVSQFLFAAQTVISQADPNRHAGLSGALSTPWLVQEMVGDGADNLPDQVIPNQTSLVPFGGTEPLAALLGVAAIDSSSAGSRLLIRFSKGHHGSLITPQAVASAPDAAASSAANAELQVQIASFLASGGAAVTIADPSVVAPAN